MENTQYINTSTDSKKFQHRWCPVPGTQGNHSFSSHSIPTSWPYQTPSILPNGYFSACLPCANRAFPGAEIAEVWWSMVRPPQLTCCCGSPRCGGRSCGRSRRGGSRRHRSPSSQGGSGHSGALPRPACRDSRRCWGHRRCGGPGGARPIPQGGRSKLQGRDTGRDRASVSAQPLHHKGAGKNPAYLPRDTPGVSRLFYPSLVQIWAESPFGIFRILTFVSYFLISHPTLVSCYVLPNRPALLSLQHLDSNPAKYPGMCLPRCDV